ncbi:NUDIX domain-containing protein [Tessaracoccus sp. OH4464_COT-324]|uniref:NUDIX hydrolase n=1 Tax=Tessaracoccus sp. OH4464_COT-324 TaxID=2491059 RepID=UPI0018F59691|nr:NUDIX domain-containing protein [Tessaracoccus sp. OH4464_COT-324]
MSSTRTGVSGPLRDESGVAKYRHEAIAAVLRATPGVGLTVLATRRKREPFAGQWALLSSATEVEESLDQAVLRHLGTQFDVNTIGHLEQLETRSAPGRDPFDRTIATGYLALMAWDVDPQLPPDVHWLLVAEASEMAFDHAEVTASAVERLRTKLSYTNIGFALAAEQFTIAQLREAYVAVLGYDVAPTNLQRILQRRGQLVATGETVPPGAEGGRPAKLRRFTSRELMVTDPFVVLKP